VPDKNGIHGQNDTGRWHQKPMWVGAHIINNR
jgi:hypothetical protein